MKKILLILFFTPIIGFASFPILDGGVDDCDNIILKDGKEMLVKVVELTPNFIKYKRCDHLDGPLISMSKSDVLMIRYSNGSKDIFSIDEEGVYSLEIDSNRTSPPTLGILSLCVSIAAVLVGSLGGGGMAIGLALLACTFGIGAVSKEKTWGIGLAGLIISGIIVVSALLAALFYQ